MANLRNNARAMRSRISNLINDDIEVVFANFQISRDNVRASGSRLATMTDTDIEGAFATLRISGDTAFDDNDRAFPTLRQRPVHRQGMARRNYWDSEQYRIQNEDIAGFRASNLQQEREDEMQELGVIREGQDVVAGTSVVPSSSIAAIRDTREYQRPARLRTGRRPIPTVLELPLPIRRRRNLSINNHEDETPIPPRHIPAPTPLRPQTPRQGDPLSYAMAMRNGNLPDNPPVVDPERQAERDLWDSEREMARERDDEDKENEVPEPESEGWSVQDEEERRGIRRARRAVAAIMRWSI